MLILPVLFGGKQSGPDPETSRGDAPRLALDPDLGPDPSPGSAVLQIRVLCEPEEANVLFFDRFLSKPDFGPVVVFLDCPLHHGHRTSCERDAQMTRISPGRSGSEYWTRIRSPSGFFTDVPKKTKRGRVPYGTECGPGCRCRVRSPLLCGTAPFYGTGARAESRIRTHVSDPCLNPQSVYRILSKLKL